MDKLIELMNEISDAECELEELNECGTLEERLEIAQKIEELKISYFKQTMIETGGL